MIDSDGITYQDQRSPKIQSTFIWLKAGLTQDTFMGGENVNTRAHVQKNAPFVWRDGSRPVAPAWPLAG
jgi:hypothetical protein